MKKYDDEARAKIKDLFESGKTYKQIGECLDIPRRTVGKLCNLIGLSRSTQEVANLVIKSPLDTRETIALIKELRSHKSLQEIADKLNSSVSAVHRICVKHGIQAPSDYNTIQSERMKVVWTDKKRKIASIASHNRVTDELREKLSENSKQLWRDDDYRNRQKSIQKGVWACADRIRTMSDTLIAIWADEDLRARMSKIQKEIWADEEKRQYIRDIQLEIWKNPEYRLQMAVVRANQPIVSSIQNHLYEILTDLNIKHYREHEDKPNDPETIVGPYNFDCVIPRENQPDLLIECQGDYFHSKQDRIVRDAQKRSYINNNFNHQYELKYLWEHEFKCKNKIYELIKYWVGITKTATVDFKFSDVSVTEIDVKTANKLLDKYHYLSGCGRGGIMFGAFFNNELIAVCAFSSLIRQNLPYDSKSTRELSRFCIHPSYQIKNFGSWMVSRSIKLLPGHIKKVISYCDTTFNHDGGLYRACNFRLDGKVRPDYWYVSEDRWVMHKKTLYSHACKMSMVEREFAEKHGYKRVYGTEKLRFIYDR